MLLNAESRLIRIRVKTKWAEKQLHNLATLILALNDVVMIPKDKNTGGAPQPSTFPFDEKAQRLPILSFDVICLAGDIVHNLRSALDHLAYQLVLIGNPAITPKELTKVYFPIFETESEYEARKATKIKGALPDAIKAIDRLKPYKGGNDALWRIHELDIIDKHRTLFTVAHDFLFTADWFKGAYRFKT